jgi:hypothetical protein
MTEADTSNSKVYSRFKALWRLGIGVGGFFPMVICLGIFWLSKHNYSANWKLYPPSQDVSDCIFASGGLLISALIVYFFGLRVLSRIQEGNLKGASWWTEVLAFICLIIVHTSVVLTGGGTQSIMSLQYFYVIALTALLYGKKPAGMTAILCIVSFILAVWWELSSVPLIGYLSAQPAIVKWWAPVTETATFRISYVVCFVVQAIMTVLLGSEDFAVRNFKHMKQS